MAKNYSLEAHLIHSGLQMIWKRLELNEKMDSDEIVKYNFEIFQSVAKKLLPLIRVKPDSCYYYEAAEMLVYSLTHEPVVYYVIRSGLHGNGHKDIESSDGGKTISAADPKSRMTEEEANDMMKKIGQLNPSVRLHMHISKRFAKDMPNGQDNE